MSHARSKDRKKKPAAKAKAVKVPETRPQTASDKRLSPFYATGPARPLAAPGAKKATAAPAGAAMAKKVAVGQPGDRYEKEADAVADKVTRGAPAPEVSHLPAGGLKTQRKEDEQEAAEESADEKTAGEETTEGDTVQKMEAGAGETGEKKEEEPGSEPAAQTAVQRQMIQRQEEGGEAGEEDMSAQEMAEEGKEEETAQTKSEEGEEPVQQQVEEEEEIQELSTRDEARENKKLAAGRAIQERGAGEPLSPGTRSTLEAGLGTDLSGVRVHRDGRARQAAKDMGARAFTHKNHIWLGPGESASDTKLMAHEATHVLQQGGVARKPPVGGGGGRGAIAGSGAGRGAENGPAPGSAPAARSGTAAPAIQRKPAAGAGGGGKSNSAKAKGGGAKKGAPPPSTGEVAPEELELLGQTEVPASEPVASWLQGRKGRRGPVPVRFGQMAKGEVEMQSDRKGRITILKKSAIPLQHELFRRLGDAAPELEPSLIFETGAKVRGYAGLKASKGLPSSNDLQKKLAQYPVLLSLPGFELPKLARAKSLSRIEAGHLEYGVEETPVSFGALFDGTFSFQGRDDKITSFSGRLAVHAQGLAEGELELRRDTTGNVEGKAAVDLDLPAGFSGGVTVEWKDDAVSGEGRVGYTGEKLSGNVTLRLMDKEKAAQLEEEKKAPPEGVDEPAAAPAEGKSKKGKKTKKKGKQEFVVFGEGDLTFAFTEWLNGTAHVIVDPEGHVTIIGKITPQKEFELFPQKDYEKQIFKVEPRLSYGLPVIGNIFIFANVSLSAFATVGPAKLYNIQVDGTYSTDPETMQSFSIQGTLNLSAAAGLKLRGEAGAGIEILDHDVKAGAGVNGLAGIRGYAEATPIIGYREKPMGDGTDKKGEFFIRGEVEIAAQPFLGLSGDLFIELDSPWWSPAPDKKWTWPLGSQEYPIGGSFGVGASVDYVFGSGTWPKVEMKEVDFSAEKFMSDLYRDKTQPKSGAAGEKKGAWKEKNQKALEPPPKEAAPAGDMKPGKAPEPPKAKAKEVAKKKGKAATADARTAEGKTVKQLKKEAKRKGAPKDRRKAAAGEPKGAKAKEPKKTAAGKPGEPKGPPKDLPKSKDEADRKRRKEAAAAEVRAALENGMRKSRLLALLADLRKRHRLESATLDADDDVVLRNSPKKEIPAARDPEEAVETATLAARTKGKGGTLTKDPKGRIRFGELTSRGSIKATLRGIVQGALGESVTFNVPMDSQAFLPSKAEATLYGWRSGIEDTSRDSSFTAKVSYLGRMEYLLVHGSELEFDGGHLLAHNLGGPDTYANVVPMKRAFNIGTFAKVENLVRSQLPLAKGNVGPQEIHTKLEILPTYPGAITTSTRKLGGVIKKPFGERTGKLAKGAIPRNEKKLEDLEAELKKTRSQAKRTELAKKIRSKKSQIRRLEDLRDRLEEGYQEGKKVEQDPTLPDVPVQVAPRIATSFGIKLRIEADPALAEKQKEDVAAKAEDIRGDKDYRIVLEEKAAKKKALKSSKGKKGTGKRKEEDKKVIETSFQVPH